MAGTPSGGSGGIKLFEMFGEFLLNDNATPALQNVQQEAQNTSNSAKSVGEQMTAILQNINQNIENLLKAMGVEVAHATEQIQNGLQDVQQEMQNTERAPKKLTDIFKEQFAKARSAIANIQEQFEKFGAFTKGVGDFVSQIMAAPKALYEMASSVAEASADIKDNSDKLGISSTAYQEWAFILKKNGSDIQTLAPTFKALNNAIDGLGKGSKEQVDAFNKLGVSIKDVNGNNREMGEIYNDVIAKLQDMKPGLEKTALATSLLGKGAMELNPTINDTAENLENMRKNAYELGQVLDENSVKAGDNFSDTMESLQMQSKGLMNAIGVQLIPVFQKLAEWLQNHREDIKLYVNNFIVGFGAVLVKTSEFAKFITDIGNFIKNSWISIFSVISNGLADWIDNTLYGITAFYNSVRKLFGKEEVKSVLGGFTESIRSVANEFKDMAADKTNPFAGTLSEMKKAGEAMVNGTIDVTKKVNDTKKKGSEQAATYVAAKTKEEIKAEEDAAKKRLDLQKKLSKEMADADNKAWEEEKKNELEKLAQETAILKAKNEAEEKAQKDAEELSKKGYDEDRKKIDRIKKDLEDRAKHQEELDKQMAEERAYYTNLNLSNEIKAAEASKKIAEDSEKNRQKSIADAEKSSGDIISLFKDFGAKLGGETGEVMAGAAASASIAIKAISGDYIGAIKDGMANLGSIAKFVQKLFDGINNIIEGYVNFFTGKWGDLWHGIEVTFSDAWDFITGKQKNSAEKVIDMQKKVVEQSKATVEGLAGSVEYWNDVIDKSNNDTVSKGKEKIQRYYQEISIWTQDMLEKTGQISTEVATEVYNTIDKIKDALISVKDSVIGQANTLSNAINTALDKKAQAEVTFYDNEIKKAKEVFDKKSKLLDDELAKTMTTYDNKTKFAEKEKNEAIKKAEEVYNINIKALNDNYNAEQEYYKSLEEEAKKSKDIAIKTAEDKYNGIVKIQKQILDEGIVDHQKNIEAEKNALEISLNNIKEKYEAQSKIDEETYNQSMKNYDNQIEMSKKANAIAISEIKKRSETELKAIDSTKKELDDKYTKEIDVLKKAKEIATDAYKKQYDEKITNAQKAYDSTIKALQSEIDAINKNKDEAIAGYNEQYIAKVKLIDEDLAKTLQSIEEQKQAIKTAQENEKREREVAKYEAEKAKAEEAVNIATSEEEKVKAMQELQKILTEWTLSELERSRQQKLDILEKEAQDAKDAAKKKLDDAKANQEELAKLAEESAKIATSAVGNKVTEAKTSLEVEKDAAKSTYEADIQAATDAANKKIELISLEKEKAQEAYETNKENMKAQYEQLITQTQDAGNAQIEYYTLLKENAKTAYDNLKESAKDAYDKVVASSKDAAERIIANQQAEIEMHKTKYNEITDSAKASYETIKETTTAQFNSDMEMYTKAAEISKKYFDEASANAKIAKEKATEEANKTYENTKFIYEDLGRIAKEEHEKEDARREAQFTNETIFLQDRLDAAKEYQTKLQDQAFKDNQAMLLLEDSHQKELVGLLEKYNPNWQNAGQTFGEKLVEGLRSSKVTIEGEIQGVLGSLLEYQKLSGNLDAQTSNIQNILNPDTSVKNIKQSAQTGLGQVGTSINQTLVFNNTGKIDEIEAARLQKNALISAGIG